jgi:hypothetical protein
MHRGYQNGRRIAPSCCPGLAAIDSDCDRRSSSWPVVKSSLCPSPTPSNPTILRESQTSDQSLADTASAFLATYLSRVTPSTKVITHGRTLISSLTTKKGTFATCTLMKRVPRWRAARDCERWRMRQMERQLVHTAASVPCTRDGARQVSPTSRCLSISLHRRKSGW